MAGDLHTLIRLGKWEVDEKRRVLGELLRQLYALEEQARLLESRLVEEQRVAAAKPSEAGYLYGAYAKAVVDRRESLARAIASQESQVEAAQEALRVAHGDLKKYEMVQEERDRLAAEERDRKEQIVLDEIGLRGFVRRRGRTREG